jgi:hypothetical protein
VHVDKTGTHDAALSVDLDPGPNMAQLTDCGYPASGNADVGPAHTRAGTVNDLPTCDQKIHTVHLKRRLCL